MKNVSKVITRLKKEYPRLPMKDEFGRDPYQLLIAVMLSARSMDKRTIPVAKELFAAAAVPSEMAGMKLKDIEKILRPIGFFRQKARYTKGISKRLVEEYGGEVPHTREELMSLPGVGRKTANIVLSQYFGQDTVGVDVHVHRITNRLGWFSTKGPTQTEREIVSLVPKKYLSDVNHVFVRHGQEVCRPISPKCDVCPVYKYCLRVGVRGG